MTRELHGVARWHRAIADADLGATDKAVLRALIDLIPWPKKGEPIDPQPECWPGVQTIADAAGLRSRKGTQNVLKRLRDKGLLTFADDRRGGMGANGKPKTARYRLNLERLDAIKRVPRSR